MHIRDANESFNNHLLPVSKINTCIKHLCNPPTTCHLRLTGECGSSEKSSFFYTEFNTQLRESRLLHISITRKRSQNIPADSLSIAKGTVTGRRCPSILSACTLYYHHIFMHLSYSFYSVSAGIPIDGIWYEYNVSLYII